MDMFDFTDYKDFLNKKLDNLDQGGRGSRARMSRAIVCQTAYTAQVLRGHAHFSLEQAEAINDFLGHTEDQGSYFLLMVQLAKAGSEKLRSRFQKQMQEIQKSRALLKNKLEVKSQLAEIEQLRYYNSWIYGAIHAIVSVPGFQSPESIAKRLDLEVRQVSDALEFLIAAKLLEREKKGELTIGQGQIHIGADSPLISKHHINWRLQAIRAIERNPRDGLHYSSVISISKKDFQNVQKILVETLKEIKTIIRGSDEEQIASLNLDLFEL